MLDFATHTTLSACGFHGNVEIGKRVIEHISELEDYHAGDYVILSNMCFVDGLREDVYNIRKLMKERGSSIEVDNVVRELFSVDGVHPQSEELHLMLDDLVEQIKLVGYVPNTSLVFPADMTEELTVGNLRCHSEKLAIAVGLMNTPPVTSLRVVKNLRLCADCHSAAKYISSLQ